MKTKFISDLQFNEKIQDAFFAIKGVKSGKTMNGNDYIDLVLSDKTGEVAGKIWEKSIGNCAEVKVGDIVTISGTVEEFRDKQQLNIQFMQKVDDYELDDFLPKTTKDINLLWKNIKTAISGIDDQYLKKLANAFYANDQYTSKIKNASAAEYIHHAYIGGLIEHICEMLETATVVIKQYPELNSDLLICGVLLHDIGKIDELNVGHIISRSTAGSLIGHITLGAIMVNNEIDKIKGFPDDLKTKILHLIISHHGMLEFGSPVKPALREAFALTYLDNLSAKVNTAEKVYQDNQNSNGDFSAHNYALDNKLYLK